MIHCSSRALSREPAIKFLVGTDPEPHPFITPTKGHCDNPGSLERPRHAGPIADALAGDLGVPGAQKIADMSSERRTELAMATRDRVAKIPASRVKSLARSEIAFSDRGESVRSRAEMGFVLI
jgi:hypothetical protein